MSRDPKAVMLEALRVTEGNIRSLGPAGHLSEVWPCYRIWLQVVQSAIEIGEQKDEAK